jgi:hypothetical protein
VGQVAERPVEGKDRARAVHAVAGELELVHDTRLGCGW